MIHAKMIKKARETGLLFRYIRIPCCEYSGMTQSGIKKKVKKMKKLLIDTSEIDRHVQSLKDLYTCIMFLQDMFDEFDSLDHLYDTLTDYLMVVERTARFLSRIKILLKTLEIEEAVNDELV